MMVMVFGFIEKRHCKILGLKPQINADERRFIANLFEQIHQLIGTRMTRIGRIFTDIFNPCASVSSVKSVFYPMENKPPMAQSIIANFCAACILCGGLTLFTAKGAKTNQGGNDA